MRKLPRSMVCFCLTLASLIWYSRVAHPLPTPPLQQANLPNSIATPPTPAIAVLQVTIANDPADLYLPMLRSVNARANALPIALMLPGALVDRAYYSQFASAVARYGFAVVVPSHKRSIPEFKVSGELSEVSQVTTTLSFLEQENANPKSPLYQKLNPSRMALLGHSHGGFVGLQAIANVCTPPFCFLPFSRPDAVTVGVFYGVNNRNPRTGKYSPTPNDNIPIALVQGSLDGVATPERAIATYDLIQTPPKALITIKGSNHFGITNINNPPGARPDRSSPTLEQAQGVQTIAQWTAYFLRAHLYQDLAAYKRIYGSADGANRKHHPDPLVTITSVAK